MFHHVHYLIHHICTNYIEGNLHIYSTVHYTGGALYIVVLRLAFSQLQSQLTCNRVLRECANMRSLV